VKDDFYSLHMLLRLAYWPAHVDAWLLDGLADENNR